MIDKNAPIAEQIGADRWRRWEQEDRKRIYSQMLHNHSTTDGLISSTCEACKYGFITLQKMGTLKDTRPIPTPKITEVRKKNDK